MLFAEFTQAHAAFGRGFVISSDGYFYMNSDSIIVKKEKEKNLWTNSNQSPITRKEHTAFTRQMKMYYHLHLATQHNSLKTYTDSKKVSVHKVFLVVMFAMTIKLSDFLFL